MTTCVTVGRPSGARSWHSGGSLMGFFVRFWLSLAWAFPECLQAPLKLLTGWSSGSPQGISKFTMGTEAVIRIVYIWVRILLHFSLSHYPPCLFKTHRTRPQITETAMTEGSRRYLGSKHPQPFPSFWNRRPWRGLESFPRCCITWKSLQTITYQRTDGFLAFVEPPSSTLGGHWNDDNAPFMGRVV